MLCFSEDLAANKEEWAAILEAEDILHQRRNKPAHSTTFNLEKFEYTVKEDSKMTVLITFMKKFDSFVGWKTK